MKTTPDIKNLTNSSISDIQFNDIFNLEDIQCLQDLFSDAHGIASIITHPDGTPITKPSNFCRLCNNIIRKTGKGRANCFKSDAAIGKQNSSGPIVQPCLSGGLWDAGASITVGGKHIANWLIGQVRNNEVDEQRIIQYADEIGANREDFRKAFYEVPVMSVEQFNKVAKMLFAFASELSEKAYNNWQLKIQMAEREKATVLLQESEDRFQLLFNKAPLSYQSLDFDGNFIEVNQQWLDTLGYTREEVIGKWFGDFLSPAYQKGFRKQFQIFKAEGMIHSEFEMVHKNGNKLFIAFEGRIGYDLNGEFKQTYCILQDITERKQAEEALHESRQILEAIINTIPARVFWKDKNLTYLGCNATFALDAGFEKPEDVIGKDDYTMGWSEQAELYRTDDRLVIGSGKPKLLIEEPQTTSSGEQIYLLTNKVPLKDATGEILGVLGTYFDITKRKQTEEALRQSKRELSTLMDNLPGMVYSCLYDQDWTMKFVSEGSFDLTGYMPDELIDNKIISYEEIIHPDDRKMVWVTIRDALEKKTAFTLEYRIVTKCGDVKNVWERGQGLYTSIDTLHHLEGFITDITERKLAETEQERLLYIMESSLNEIYIFDSVSLIFEYVNRGALRNLGYTREAMQSMTPVDIKPEFTEASFRQTITPLLRHEQEQLLFNTVHRRADGSLYPVEVHLQLVQLEGQQVFLAVILDITERKLAEEALRKSEAIQGKMVANIGDVIVIIDQEGIIRYKSPNIEKLFGWRPEEIVGESTWENLHPEDLDSVQRLFGTLMGEPNATDTTECRYRCKDGSYKWIELTGVNLLYDPDIQGILGNFHDITDRKQAEEALREREARLNLALQSANMSIWHWDIIGDRRYFDDQACYLLGINPTTFTGAAEEFFGAVHPDDRQTIKTALARTIGKDVLYGMEYRSVWPDESVHYIAARGKLSRDDKGMPVRINGVIWDITESKQKEDVLLKLKKAVDNSGEIIFLTDKEGIFTFVNPAFTSIYGFTSDEIVGKVSPRILKSGLMEVNDYELFWETLLSGKEVRGELINKRKDGTSINIDSTANPIFDEKKNIIGFLGIQRDITERILAEKQIKLLSRAIDQSPITVMITNKQGKIEYANPKFTELTGYTSDEVKGKNPRFLQSGKYTREFYDELWTTILSGKDWIGEFYNKKKNGDFYLERATISSIVNSHGDISFFIGVMEDITEKKKMMEDLIQAKERAEESDRLKTSFLNNISHEIRTPFNGILGFLSILEDNELTTSERAEYTSIVNKSAFRLMNTVNDIVEISQIQAGQMVLSESETNIRRLTSEVYNQFKTDAESKGLKFYINNDLPINIDYIYTDSPKLNAILTILISNAIKFTKTGSIEFGIRLVDKVDEHAVETHGRASLQFSVKDTGIGIPENKLQVIFERFMQADGSNTRSFEGSGLGLSIAKAYVEMLGGTIWVESQEGKGAEFRFTILYKDKQEEKTMIENAVSVERAENQIIPEVSGLKILIAEDDEGSAMLIEMSVRIVGKEIIVVRTGVEAVEACRKNPDIDLVLMDIKMPDMDGYEATEKIRQFNTSVVIIAQTAYALTGDREKTIAAGCNDYIAKPIKKEKLLELMQKYFKK